MKIYFLRHGEADWENWERPDDERPLTKKGKKEVRKISKSFADYGVRPAVVLSSPLPRAYQTAELVADELGRKLTEEPRLAPGFDAEKLAAILKEHPGEDVMLVGHEPSFSQTIEATTGARVKLAKAGLARVDYDNPTEARGLLVWLIPPRISTI